MAKRVNQERVGQILNFVSKFNVDHGCGPTIREIGKAVGVSSSSTISDYLGRMARDGLITYIPGTTRSLRVISQNQELESFNGDICRVCCDFKFPEGSNLMSVIAMVAKPEPENGNNCQLIMAESYDILRSGV